MDSNFQKNTIARFGQKGKIWLENLQQIVAFYERKWGIIAKEPFVPLSYNYVVAAERNGKPVVLKIAYPTSKEFLHEVTALELFGKEIAPHVVEKDLSGQAVLLEQVFPGKPLQLFGTNAEQATIAAHVGKKLWKNISSTNHCVFLQDWFAESFSRYEKKYPTNGPIDQKFYQEGKNLALSLLQKSRNELIHGDFHHMNMLASGDSWRIIDPKGVIGDRWYDVAVFLHNPMPEFIEKPNVKQLLSKRIAIFSKELDISREEIIHWGIAQSLLSELWTVEDKGTWRRGADFAKLLKSLY